MNLVIDFMGKRKIAGLLSIIFVLVSIVSLAYQQLNYGLDFTGGTKIEFEFEQAVDVEKVRNVLNEKGFTRAVVQVLDSEKEIAIRIADGQKDGVGQDILNTLKAEVSDQITLVSADFVGSSVGEELREQGGLGMLIALMVVMVYVGFRFQIKFAVAAVVALFHDVMIILGVFSVFQIDFDLTILAAVLAVIGYSLNDTIVVADRIRENFRKMREEDSLTIINDSLNQTLGRTLMTSLTTLLVLIALFVVGGPTLHGFSIALIVGVVVGTYSSIYVAANILVLLNIQTVDMLPPVKEGLEEEGIIEGVVEAPFEDRK